MIKSRLRFFCSHRKYLSFFLLLIFNHILYAHISDPDSILKKTADNFIKVESGAILYLESESTIEKGNAKIYVVEGTIVKNLSAESNVEIVYLEKKRNVSNKVVKNQDPKPAEKAKSSVNYHKPNHEATLYFTSSSEENIFNSLSQNGSEFIISSQNSSKNSAILQSNLSVAITPECGEKSGCFFKDFNQLTSFNSNLNVRPPPSIF